MLPFRHWMAPALYMAIIIALSSIPGSTAPVAQSSPTGWIPPFVANALHVPVYAGLAFLWAHALIRANGMTPRQAALLAFAIAAAFGALDEFYQGLVPGRTTALMDWLADTAGAAVGSTLYLGRHQWRSRQKRS